jgi:murein DD-endopeptidase MepM/ murein hydrolase activator NlpD
MARQRTKFDRRRALAFASLIALPVILSACTPERPAYVVDPERGDYPSTEDHRAFTVTVHEGDTVSSIAARCNTNSDQIIDLNDLDDPQSIHRGQVLRVPSGDCNEWAGDARPRPRPYHERIAREDANYVVPRPRPDRYDSQPPLRHEVDDHPADNSWLSWWTDGGYDKAPDSGTSRFIWPVRGSVIEAFGRGRHGEGNDGINIASEDGAPIRAAASGVVTYTGNEIRGYGNLVLIKHDGGYVTAYAHAGSIRVSRGDRVEKGQVIATVGETGDVDRPQLHFEIRRGVQAVDPQRYLVDRAS